VVASQNRTPSARAIVICVHQFHPCSGCVRALNDLNLVLRSRPSVQVRLKCCTSCPWLGAIECGFERKHGFEYSTLRKLAG
jgi:hypothetical protein